MKYVIASDFHIKCIETNEDKNQKYNVVKFLESLIGNIDGLILAGDVFDFWMEWDNVIIKNYFPIFYIFKRLKESGCRLVLIAGNHDFWFGNFLEDYIGFEVYSEFFREELNGKKIYISHGYHFLIKNDKHRFLHKILKFPFIKKMSHYLHPSISLLIGDKFSNAHPNSEKSESIIQYTDNILFHKAVELAKDYDIVVLGHTHLPKLINIGKSVYVNCGDWITHNSYCLFDDKKIDLKIEKKIYEV